MEISLGRTFTNFFQRSHLTLSLEYSIPLAFCAVSPFHLSSDYWVSSLAVVLPSWSSLRLVAGVVSDFSSSFERRHLWDRQQVEDIYGWNEYRCLHTALLHRSV